MGLRPGGGLGGEPGRAAARVCLCARVRACAARLRGAAGVGVPARAAGQDSAGSRSLPRGLLLPAPEPQRQQGAERAPEKKVEGAQSPKRFTSAADGYPCLRAGRLAPRVPVKSVRPPRGSGHALVSDSHLEPDTK